MNIASTSLSITSKLFGENEFYENSQAGKFLYFFERDRKPP